MNPSDERTSTSLLMAIAVIWSLLAAPTARAVVDGVHRADFNLTAKDGYITLGDGDSLLAWGYANGAGPMQYPGVTMIVNQGDLVTVRLSNKLSVPVSIVFPGQKNVTASGGVAGLLTREVPPDNGATTVTYRFIATHAGTYLYQSGTRPDLQVEMGLVGALIVRPDHGEPGPAGLCPSRDELRSRVSVSADRDGSAHP